MDIWWINPDLRGEFHEKTIMWLGNPHQFRESMDPTWFHPPPLTYGWPRGVGKVVVVLHLAAVGSEGFRIAQEGATAAA